MADYREEQKRVTRDRIADAARRLFARQGYQATSIEAIAAAAGVGIRTVYAAYGNKRELLSAICELCLEQAKARDVMAAALAEPTASRRLQAGAFVVRNLHEHGFDVEIILDGATDAGEATRVVLRAKLDGRNAAMDSLVASIEGSLRVPLRDAQAIFRALGAPSIWRDLVVDAGWSPDAFEDWLAGILCRQLLDRAAPSRRRQGGHFTGKG